MNPVFNVSSRQGGMLHPEEEEKGKGTAGSTERLLKGMAGGRSVSPAAGVDALAMASAGRDAGVTQSNDRYALSCREPEQQAASGTGSSGMPVDSVDDARARLLANNLYIIDQLINPGDKERMQTVTPQARKMHDIQLKALELLDDNNKLKEADEMLEPVFEYVDQSGDIRVACNLCRSKAFVLHAMEDFPHALMFFERARKLDNSNIINFSESMLVQYLMLAIEVDSSVIRDEIFDPEGFYDEIQRWLPNSEVQEDDVEESLESEFGNDRAPAVKIFRNAIKAIFAEEDILAAGKVKHFIDQLDEFQNSKPETKIMQYAVYILEFAMNSRLVKQGRFKEASENIKFTASHEFKYLGEYIRCQVLRETGEIDQAIRKCKQDMVDGCPFAGYLLDLQAAETEAGQKTT